MNTPLLNEDKYNAMIVIRDYCDKLRIPELLRSKNDKGDFDLIEREAFKYCMYIIEVINEMQENLIITNNDVVNFHTDFTRALGKYK